MTLNYRRKWLWALSFAVAAGALAAGCEDALDPGSERSLRPIPNETLALMDKIGTTPSAPVLIRTYKQEAEFEIWKMNSDGQYALLKTYPMCRWSGQLGPKTRQGDMQVPEGFYTIAPGQMNPNSHYYLSFNVGYPNAYDRALGRTGGAIMVHGVCSSAGCFSMTDAQIGEIYAIAREAFNGGESAIQMQSYPFRMTAENLAKHRLNPNIDFWKELKNGADHFEVTKNEPSVLVCGKHYVFGASADGDVDPSRPCPTLQRDDQVEADVAAKEEADQAAVAELVAKGVKPVRIVYQDGGQNAAFAGRDLDVSDPDALAIGPTEIALDPSGKPIPAAVKVVRAAGAHRGRRRGDDGPGRRPALAVRLRRRRRRQRAEHGQEVVRDGRRQPGDSRFRTGAADSLRRAAAAQAQRRARRVRPAGRRRARRGPPCAGQADAGVLDAVAARRGEVH
jgi:murein L,D-transpeptidase YafK